MGDVIEGKFPQRPPRSPPNPLAMHLRNMAAKVESGEIVALEAIFIEGGRPMYLHGANLELALQLARVLVECNLQRIPAVVTLEEAK